MTLLTWPPNSKDNALDPVCWL